MRKQSAQRRESLHGMCHLRISRDSASGGQAIVQLA